MRLPNGRKPLSPITSGWRQANLCADGKESFTMKPAKKMNRSAREMAFATELWKLILAAEDLVRNHYMKLAKREIYDLNDDEEEENDRFFLHQPTQTAGGTKACPSSPRRFYGHTQQDNLETLAG
jgi:hypothetical protein